MKISRFVNISLVFLAFIGVANANNEMQVNQIVAMVKSMGQFKEISRCTGVSESKVEKEYRSQLIFCVNKAEGFDSDEVEQCFVDRLPKAFGVSKENLENCIQE